VAKTANMKITRKRNREAQKSVRTAAVRPATMSQSSLNIRNTRRSRARRKRRSMRMTLTTLMPLPSTLSVRRIHTSTSLETTSARSAQLYGSRK